ncbi:hypothetical protein [Streptomyces sp. NPDC051452]|uniref:hypothetical protein n=1 Tax=Streptomyces sp. NPDC051452 TaxID=3365654 RepID=UPI0037990B12
MSAPRPHHLTAGQRTRRRLVSALNEITRSSVAEIRITPARYGDGTVWCAMALTAGRREVPLPGHARQVASLIREAFPLADWSRAQDYHVTSGVLREHVTPMPAALNGGER